MGAAVGRASTVARGAAAETLAVEYLVGQGYRVLQRNFRCAGGEVDIIADEAGVLCFVEVRSRENDRHGDPLETIGPRKRQRIIHAARIYIGTLTGPWPQMRFDAVGIVMRNPPEITLVRDAFEV